MFQFDRRHFFRTLGAAGAGLPALAAGNPSLSIAHYKTCPTEPDGIAEEAKRLTRKSIEGLGGMSRFVSKGDVVWVKPNIGWDRSPEQAATTNPDVVATLVSMCFECGAKRVVVSDNSCNSAQRTFPRSGIQPAAEKAGAQVFFLDPRKFRKMAINGKVLHEWEIYQDVVEADKFINVAIVKHHSLSKLTLGMKNLMGVTGGARNRFHQEIDKTLADIAVFLKPKLVVLDAVRVLTANGPVGGNLADVKRKDTVIAGVDQVAVDAYGATLMGHKPEEISYIVEAAARGLGTMNFNSLSPKMVEL
jgi:uncharacterized protein (DUF362 family)